MCFTKDATLTIIGLILQAYKFYSVILVMWNTLPRNNCISRFKWLRLAFASFESRILCFVESLSFSKDQSISCINLINYCETNSMWKLPDLYLKNRDYCVELIQFPNLQDRKGFGRMYFLIKEILYYVSDILTCSPRKFC